MVTPLLRNLIAHVISELDDLEASYGKTKLVKILYLVDVENYSRRGEIISGLDWAFYHYGPYAFEVDAALEALNLDVPQETVTTEAGRRAIVFRPSRDLNPELHRYIASPEWRLVTRVVKRWAPTELNALLNHVYFYTEPMRHATRGDVLDFSTIPLRRAKVSEFRVKTVSPDRLEELRSRLQAARAERTRQPLDPAPRFDLVYEEGLAHMNEGEQYGVPSGALDMSEEAKEDLRRQGDLPPSG